MSTRFSTAMPAALEWAWAGAAAADLDALRAAMDALPVAVMVLDVPADRPPGIVAYNGPYATLVGEVPRRGEPLDTGMRHHLFLPDRVRPMPFEDGPGTRAVRTGAPVRDVELHVRRPDGSWRVASVTALPFARRGGAEPRRAVVLAVDVTEQWSAAEVRRRYDATLREREVRFRALVEHSQELIITSTRDGIGTYASAATESMFGLPPEAFVGRRARDFVHPDDLPRAEAAREAVAATRHGIAQYETRSRHRDGSWRTVAVTVRNLLDVPGVESLVINVRDVTAEREAESRARRARRALVALTQANEAIARAADEAELLDRVCRVLVETAGYRMCWVGAVVHDAARSIRPVARAGHDDGFVDGLRPTWGETARGYGPSAQVVRTREPQFARDFLEEPLAPWREEAAARGYAALTMLPLQAGGEVVAVLYVYASEREAFDGEELEFLVRLAGDVSHGLAALRERAERARAEEALRVSRGELRALAGRLDAVREEEKARIARDLHDELGQLLTGLRVDLDSIEERLAELPAGPVVRDLVERAVDASDLVGRAVGALREVLSVLRPAALDHLGLAAALRQECRRFEERTRIPCRAALPESLSLDPEVETALFRIAQEALTNVARHAAAREVSVSVALEGAAAVLRVSDDGAGLAAAGAPHRGLGIVGMSERAARLGGELTVAPGRAGGTVVTARIPLARSEGAR